MAARSVPHLMRRGHALYFRRAIPRDLVGYVGRREIKVALGTNDLDIGRIRCRTVSNGFDIFVGTVRSMPKIDPVRLDGLLKRYFQGLLSEADELVYMLRHDQMADFQAEAETADAQGQALRMQLAADGQDPEATDMAIQLLKTADYKPIEVGLDTFDEFRQGVLRAKIEQRRILAAMLRGNYQEIAPKDPLFLNGPGSPTASGSVTPPVEPVATLIDRHVKYKVAAEWKDKTADENRRVLRWLSEFVGEDCPIIDLTLKDIRDFRDGLLRAPKGATKLPTFGGKELRNLVRAKPPEQGLHGATLQKYFSVVRGFCQWCVEEGYLSVSPAEKIKVPVKLADSARRPWTGDELRQLFASPQFRGHKSAARRGQPGKLIIKDGKFWVPLVGLYSGMRLGEIVQLRVPDIRTVDGIDVIDVNASEGKSLKTATSRRLIPIHPTLRKLGLLDYLKER
ncbi:MAG: DUF6538 domain-containing protein, partial [Alphaproteobacteria bacterium]